MRKVRTKRWKKMFSKKLKWGIGLIFVLIMIFQVRAVEAGMSDAVIEKNRRPDVYAAVVLNGIDHYYYLNMYTLNGRIAYCIDLGVDITTDIYNSTDDFAISNLGEEQIEFLRAVSYFGYSYPGHDIVEFYMAAQEIIWEYLGDVEVEWVDDTSLFANKIDVEFYKNEILGLISSYQRDINFEWSDSNIVSLGDEFIIHDAARIISAYEIEVAEHSEVSILYDDLIVRVGTDYVGRETIVLRRRTDYSYSSMFYYFDNSQRLISGGNMAEKQKEVSFYIEGADLNIQIIDKETKMVVPQGQASFEGAVYELYRLDGTLIDEFETDENGRAVISNLVYGSYYIKQISSSLGYLLNEEVVFFDLNASSYYLRLEEQVIVNQFEFRKLYGGSESEIVTPEEGISFLIYDTAGAVYKKILTDENGLATFILPYGEYLVHQENSSFGYAKVDDFRIKVEEFQEQIIKYSLLDSLIECTLQVVALDNKTREIIKSNGFRYMIYDIDNDRYLDFAGEKIFDSDLNGILNLPMKLKYGNYRLEQIGVGNGYFNAEQKIELIINENSDFELDEGGLRVVVDVFYEMVMGQIELTTTREIFYASENKYTYKVEQRENVEVELFANDDIQVNGIILYQKNDVIGSFETNSEGVLNIENIYLGNYCLKERQSNLEECFILEVVSDKQLVVVEKVELREFLGKADILLYNFSEDGQEIEGSIFEIYDGTNQLIYTGITDGDGLLKVPNLTDGEYCIEQKKVGDLAYELGEERKCVELVTVEGEKRVEYINLKKAEKFVFVPNTFKEKEDLKKLIILVILGLGGFIYQKKRIKNNSN